MAKRFAPYIIFKQKFRKTFYNHKSQRCWFWRCVRRECTFLNNGGNQRSRNNRLLDNIWILAVQGGTAEPTGSRIQVVYPVSFQTIEPAVSAISSTDFACIISSLEANTRNSVKLYPYTTSGTFANAWIKWLAIGK